ncbi:uncharacterized protein N7479_007742 [Penicillium vulpinum]|uniref:uncharacterized protein n=1 Tax=Penicillium vulpinum TaxID=29845 RepID=UPI002547B51D|nr:uncharacterized protein N7479_007742 [Penicillium vulpinum]KAJ5960592.1 hypothetical protein N7479_007742 [Penicillium vulpinum]
MQVISIIALVPLYFRQCGPSMDKSVIQYRKCGQQAKFQSIWFEAHVEIPIILNITEMWTVLIALTGAPLWPLFKKWDQQSKEKQANKPVMATSDALC